jgi:GTP diphosphokinase / guanosine-3',5'-bis(diphosphate) 3'-diphosphatase
MQEKHLSFSQVLDIYGFRVIVKDVPLLSRARRAARPLQADPGKFKDYIAIPKANGYQSLHTTLFGPFGMPIEVQIRTDEMHKIAEAGVASHWLYKSSDARFPSCRRRPTSGCRACSRCNPSRATRSSSSSTQGRPVPRRGLRLHAQGQIMALPRGATAVDFAYAVHTDIGNRCVAAKINTS